ncbi:uncharacterized protein LOC126671286 [Mercurialis annua]|uniref:uncharacterized protein LOC126671286 n=1 Tax=Mercurialis annua TaxID=3986 RepID=UPI00215F9C88|nr:uncharacterized protein LOC126671286 [Mercurialis annua]
MLKTFHFKSQLFIPKSSDLWNPNGEIFINYPKSPIFRSLPLLSHQTHIPKPIISARNKRKRFGSIKLRQIFPKLVSIAASNLKILPEPFNLVTTEFLGGGGSNGGVGGGGPWFDMWGRKRKKKINLGFLLVLELGLVLLAKEFKIDAFYSVLILGLILIKGFKRGITDLVVQICFVGALMGLKLKRGEMQQWLQKVRVCSPVVELVMGKRSRNGSRFL